jgi:hypothetical protein
VALTATPVGLGAQAPLGLEQIAERAMPAVVLIDVQTAADRRQGSGFLVDATGRILTNHHVIRNAKSARVRLASGDVYEQVEVLAEDERRDIAVLQIPGFDLPWLELGNSDSVKVGAQVVLIGSPLGLENTVSTGIVSGRRREPEGFQLIQVSAAASQGSSGGAVLDADGRVVGIASSQMEGGQNLNFAVPVNYARGLLTHLGEVPLVVLAPASAAAAPVESRTTRTAGNVVNQGLTYRLGDFHGLRSVAEAEQGSGLLRKTRMTYRVIEALGAPEPLIELYRERETTRRTEPFGTLLTVRRERSRVVVRRGGLAPISASGETAWWNGMDWVTAHHDLRFEGSRVLGIVSDSAGSALELDRELPQGIVLHELRDLAFALLAVDSLIGRSVEFVTFDARTGGIDHERFDVRDSVTVEVAGTRRRGLEVNVARGLDNETVIVRAQPPRVPLRRVSGDGREVEQVTLLEFFAQDPRRRDGSPRHSGPGMMVALLIGTGPDPGRR